MALSSEERTKLNKVEYLEVDLRQPWIAAICAWIFPGAGHFYQRRYLKGVIFMVCILATYFAGLIMGGGHVVYASWVQHDKRWQYICQVGVGLPALPAIVQCRRARGQEFVVEIRNADFDQNNQVSNDELVQLFEFKKQNAEFSQSKAPLTRYFPARILSKWDRNSDGALDFDELPRHKSWFNGLMAPPGPVNPYRSDQLAEWHYEYGALFELGTLYTMIAGLLNVLAIFDAQAGPLILAQEESEETSKPKQIRMKFN